MYRILKGSYARAVTMRQSNGDIERNSAPHTPTIYFHNVSCIDAAYRILTALTHEMSSEAPPAEPAPQGPGGVEGGAPQQQGAPPAAGAPPAGPPGAGPPQGQPTQEQLRGEVDESRVSSLHRSITASLRRSARKTAEFRRAAFTGLSQCVDARSRWLLAATDATAVCVAA